MKALEILKNPSFVIPANGNHIYKKESIYEAIAELEALQEENEHLKRMLEVFKKENK